MALASLDPEVLRSLEGVPAMLPRRLKSGEPALAVGCSFSSISKSMFMALSPCSPSSNESSSRVPGIIYADGVLDRWRTGDTGDKRWVS